MIHFVINLAVIAFGAFYAIRPLWFLKRKFHDEEIPAISLRTARVVGVALVLIGIVGLTFTLSAAA